MILPLEEVDKIRTVGSSSFSPTNRAVMDATIGVACLAFWGNTCYKTISVLFN